MSSEINTQSCDVQKIVLPQGKNIATNVSPSLEPVNGSMCADASQPGVLYVGNGTTWGASSQVYYSEDNVNTMTSGGQPSITDIGVLATLSPGLIIKTCTLIVNMPNTTITTTATPITYTMTTALDAKYRPLNTIMRIPTALSVAGTVYPVIATINAGIISITLPNTVTSGVTTFSSFSATYIAAVV